MQLMKMAASSTLPSELGGLSNFRPGDEVSTFPECCIPTLFLTKWMKFNLPSLPTALPFCAEENTFCVCFWGDLSADGETAGKSPPGTARMKFCYSDKKRWSWCPILPLFLLYAKIVCWRITLVSSSGKIYLQLYFIMNLNSGHDYQEWRRKIVLVVVGYWRFAWTWKGQRSGNQGFKNNTNIDMIWIDIARKHWQERKGGRGVMKKKYLCVKVYICVCVYVYIIKQ